MVCVGVKVDVACFNFQMMFYLLVLLLLLHYFLFPPIKIVMADSSCSRVLRSSKPNAPLLHLSPSMIWRLDTGVCGNLVSANKVGRGTRIHKVEVVVVGVVLPVMVVEKQEYLMVLLI